jgi:hypothetical protein
MAMLASVPISWFFNVTFDDALIHRVAHAVIFSGVAVCMADVFLRVMRALEPTRSRLFPFIWLVLVAVIGGELAIALSLF